jgi:predicted nucleotidyltransferase
MPDQATKPSIHMFIANLDVSDIVGVILFGSRANRDHHDDSDVELAVLIDRPKSNPFPLVRHMARTAATAS